MPKRKTNIGSDHMNYAHWTQKLTKSCTYLIGSIINSGVRRT